MATLLLDGVEVDSTRLGLNYGRFDAAGLEIHRYELRVTAAELLPPIGREFDDLVEEMKADDLMDPEPSPLAGMNYPTLMGAFAFPKEFAEAIEVFLDRSILAAFAPFTDATEFVINSTDRVFVGASDLSLAGRCFKRPVRQRDEEIRASG